MEVRESLWRLPAPVAISYHRPFAARIHVTARGCSRALARAAADFGSERSFARAAEQLREHYGVRLSPTSLREATLRQARAIAARAAGAGPVRTLPARGRTKVVVAEADGTMLPIVTPQATLESPDKRRGRKVCWQEARLAAARAQGSTRTLFGATLEGGVEETGVRWGQAARAAGWGLDSRIHAVGDGAPWLAEQVKAQFGKQGGYLLDFFHVSEYLRPRPPGCTRATRLRPRRGWRRSSRPSKPAGAWRCLPAWRQGASQRKSLTKRPRCVARIVTSPTGQNSSTTRGRWRRTCPSARG